MRLMTGRNHPNFDLDGGMPQGVKTVIRAAKDPISDVPQDWSILQLLQRTLCRAKLDRDSQQWEITSVIGTVAYLSYGAVYQDWQDVCDRLFDEAMKSDG